MNIELIFNQQVPKEPTRFLSLEVTRMMSIWVIVSLTLVREDVL